MAMLGVNLPDIQPRATDHINEMIDLTSKLIENNFAYEKDGHVLFHVPVLKNTVHSLVETVMNKL